MAKRVDTNQPHIVNALRHMGASVAHLHTLGKGVPDIMAGVGGLTLVGRFNHQQVRRALAGIPSLTITEGANILVEIKHGSGTLTPDESQWHLTWTGQVAIARTIEEALQAVGLQAEI